MSKIIISKIMQNYLLKLLLQEKKLELNMILINQMEHHENFWISPWQKNWAGNQILI